MWLNMTAYTLNNSAKYARILNVSDAVDSEVTVQNTEPLSRHVFRTLSNISGQEKVRLVELGHFDKNFV